MSVAVGGGGAVAVGGGSLVAVAVDGDPTVVTAVAVGLGPVARAGAEPVPIAGTAALTVGVVKASAGVGAVRVASDLVAVMLLAVEVEERSTPRHGKNCQPITPMRATSASVNPNQAHVRLRAGCRVESAGCAGCAWAFAG